MRTHRMFPPLHTPPQRATSAANTSYLPPFMLPISLLLLLIGAGQNALLSLASVGALLTGGALLWRPGETPILLYNFLYQWLQASIAIFYSSYLGLEHAEFHSAYGTHTQSVDTATLLSLVGLVALAIGLRIGAGAAAPWIASSAKEFAQNIPVTDYVRLYAIAFGTAITAQSVAYAVPGLSQPLLALAQLKWAAFFVVTLATFGRANGNKVLWFAIFTLELALSIGGFFSNFKEVFIFSLVGLVTAGVRISARQAVSICALSSILLFFGVVWTAIKGDYRAYVSAESNTQSVMVSNEERWNKLEELISNLDGQKLVDGGSQMIRRISYVEFFGATLDYVPSYVSHENGEIWLDAIIRPFTPRLLFPDKKILDDSEMTNKYTGLGVSGMDAATSISIGYMGESYIDFGPVGMVVPIFGIGLFIGWIYRWLVHHAGVGYVVGMGLASSVIISAAALETTAPKTFGGLAVGVLIAWVFVRFGARGLMQIVRA